MTSLYRQALELRDPSRLGQSVSPWWPPNIDTFCTVGGREDLKEAVVLRWEALKLQLASQLPWYPSATSQPRRPVSRHTFFGGRLGWSDGWPGVASTGIKLPPTPPLLYPNLPTIQEYIEIFRWVPFYSESLFGTWIRPFNDVRTIIVLSATTVARFSVQQEFIIPHALGAFQSLWIENWTEVPLARDMHHFMAHARHAHNTWLVAAGLLVLESIWRVLRFAIFSNKYCPGYTAHDGWCPCLLTAHGRWAWLPIWTYLLSFSHPATSVVLDLSDLSRNVSNHFFLFIIDTSHFI